jgi:hypothetical protein
MLLNKIIMKKRVDLKNRRIKSLFRLINLDLKKVLHDVIR